MDDTALGALQRTLSDNREAKRKMLSRLAEIERESASLRAQLASLDAVIERTEQALLQLLFPVDRAVERVLRNQPAQPGDYGLFDQTAAEGYAAASYFNPPNSGAGNGEEAGVTPLPEQVGNVRFNDFRIPQAATIVLREASRPLHVSEIYRRLADGGFEFRGQYQLISLAVSLSRSKRFRKVAPGTFELNPDYQAGQVA
ncbi:MAG: hypothetical protein EBZ36_06625 [Acidobacteria bacterium]|nr:hypothetical protein [Acidobacteriota bacterium]